jgi:hypothetical protein
MYRLPANALAPRKGPGLGQNITATVHSIYPEPGDGHDRALVEVD